VRKWGGWRRYGGGVLRENSGVLILCEIAKGKIREVRRVVEKEVEEKGEARAHWRRRISPEMPADMRRSDEEFCSPRCVSCDKAKGREEMGSWGFYRGSTLRRGLGYR
jgi:hypothetical protein